MSDLIFKFKKRLSMLLCIGMISCSTLTSLAVYNDFDQENKESISLDKLGKDSIEKESLIELNNVDKPLIEESISSEG